MSKSNKRMRPIPLNFSNRLNEKRNQAIEYSVSLIDSCLERYESTKQVKKEFFNELSTLLNQKSDSVGNNQKNNINSNYHDDNEVSKEESTPSDLRNKQSRDLHNEVCDVCDQGGDLLCCDTCSLVYHLSCLHPKLSITPKGKWSCPHCIVDKLVSGDTKEAEKSLKVMYRNLSSSISKRRSFDNLYTPKGNHSNIYDVVKSGRSIIVRKIIKGKYQELARYDDLEDALAYLKSCDLSMKYEKNSSDGEDSDDNSNGSEEDLWCIYCLDDPNIRLCSFCGCRVCFGKHFSDYLLLCDRCDQETHTFCLHPPLTEIPKGSWYCDPCSTELALESKNNQPMESLVGNIHGWKSSTPMKHDSEGSSSNLVDSTLLHNIEIPRNRRGRPKGSLGRARTKGRGRPASKSLRVNIGDMTMNMESGFSPVRKVTKRSNSSDISDKPPLSAYEHLDEKIIVTKKGQCEDEDDEDDDEEEEEDDHNDHDSGNDVVGLESILGLVSTMNHRVLSTHEKEIMHIFRETAPIFDIREVLVQLVKQRDRLLASNLTNENTNTNV